VGTIVLVVGLLAACGKKELDGAKVETAIESGLRQQLNLTTVDVRCPTKVEIRPMSRFDCPVTSGDRRGVVNVTQQDDQGNIRWQLREINRR